MTSVRSRILFFFTLFAGASLLAVYMSSRSTRVVGESAETIVNTHLPFVQALEDAQVSLLRYDNAVYRYMATGDKDWLDECERQRVNYTRAFAELARWTLEPSEEDRIREIDELYVQYDNQTRHVLLSPGRLSAANMRTLKDADEYFVKIQGLLEKTQSVRYGLTMGRRVQITDILERHGKVALYFLVAIAFFFLCLALYLWHFLVKPLSLLLDGIRNFTRGKTDIQIPSIGKDELGELQEAFNEMSREINLERRRLKTESQSDALTGLFNMRYFRLQLVEEFSRSQRYGRPLTLIMIDVDNFKLYNDRNGHPAGDIVLKEVSRILIRNVRGTDIVGRYGGEEFVVLLPETPIEAAVNVAEKIRKAVEEHYFPFAGAHPDQRLTVSLGVAAYPDGHITSDQDLVESSDKALYGAKKGGRNQVFLYIKGEVVSPTALRQPKQPETAHK